MKQYHAYFLVILFVFNSCKTENTSAPKDSCYVNTTAEIIVHNSEQRSCIIYMPNFYQNSTPAPLLFNFHGFGDSVSDYMNTADMREISETSEVILVYPQGSGLDGASHWNTCPSGNDNKSTADDFGFVEAMITTISSHYNIDQSRIYAAGYSNGGMMAYGLAQYKSDRIAAVASISGVMLDCNATPSRPIPVVHFHGTADSAIPYNGDDHFSAAEETVAY